MFGGPFFGAMASAIVVGLNGALQKRFVLSPDASLVPGNVHRAAALQTGIGGKGQDVAMSLACLEFPDLALAQFVGSGPEGDAVLQLLKESVGEGAATSLTVRTASQMRTCTTIVASDESTELVEPSGVVTEEEKDQLLSKLQTSTSASTLCIMGSMPPGLPSNMYADIYSTTASSDTLTVIDSVVGLAGLLQAISDKKEHGPVLLKINASELCSLVGVKKSSSEAGGIDMKELKQAVDGFVTQFGKEALVGLALTDGKHPAHLVSFGSDDENEIYKLPTPTLDPKLTLYPIGAGDSVAAGTLASWKSLQASKTKYLSDSIQSALQKRAGTDAGQLEAAFAFGLACGSASCLKEENSVFDVKEVLELFSSMAPPELVTS